jgi:hypothetical protein
VDALPSPPLVVPPFTMALLPLAFIFPLVKLMPKVAIAPIKATIPLMIET